MKQLLFTTMSALMLMGWGGYTAFVSIRLPNEKSNPSSKTSIEQGELKNKVNIEAKIGIRFAAYNVLFGLWAKPQSIAEMFKEYDLDTIHKEMEDLYVKRYLTQGIWTKFQKTRNKKL